MAQKRVSELPQKTDPVVDADIFVGNDSEEATPGLRTKTFLGSALKAFFNKFIQLDTSVPRSYNPGQISYDLDYLAPLADTGISGIRNTIGQEDHNIFYNNTGSTILAGQAVATDLTLTGIYPNGVLSTNEDSISALSFIGLSDEDVAPGAVGMCTARGRVKGVDTSGLVQSFVYLGVNGGLINSRPDYPATRVFVGVVEVVDPTDGIINVQPRLFPRSDIGKSYSFTSTGISAGTYWKAGFYDWSSTDANLNEGAPIVNFGSAGRAYAAHPSIVAGGPGTVVGGGVVRLVARGIRDYEDGTPQQSGQTVVVLDDITSAVLNNYYEASEKMSGQITYELEVVSGAPTAYSFDFNYGYSKYDDFQDRDIAVTEFECVWQGNANDSAFDVALLHHTTTGWTYAATGFTPGNGDICRKSVDQPIAGDVDNNEDGSWKRTGLDFKVEGEGMDGVIIQIITGANATIQTMDMHIGAVSEELLR